MRERLEGTLKITEGWLKRAVGLAPAVLAIACFGTAIGCTIAGFVKQNAVVGQYRQTQSYVSHIQEEKEKLLKEFSSGMPLQEYNERINKLEGKDYAIEYLKATDEEFAKDYKQVENLIITMGVGFGAFAISAIGVAIQTGLVDDYDAFWFESAQDDIDKGERLLEKAWLARTTLPPDEHNFDSIEDEYK